MNGLNCRLIRERTMREAAEGMSSFAHPSPQYRPIRHFRSLGR